jgi:hypothetical protein
MPDGHSLELIPRYHWTNKEVAIVREHYERLGPEGLLPLLPRRTVGSIYQKGKALGLTTPLGSCGKGLYRRWASTPHIDDAIRRLYQAPPTRGAVKAFAASIARPRAWVTVRAIELGVAVTRFKEPPWTAEEIEYAMANAHRTPRFVSRSMRSRGWHRTPTAIKVKLKRLGACTEDPDHYTARGLAVLFGVDSKTVCLWITRGWLKAKRRGTERTEAQHGDQWWIHRREVRSFIVENAGIVDLRKVDRVWFIDLLANVTRAAA